MFLFIKKYYKIITFLMLFFVVVLYINNIKKTSFLDGYNQSVKEQQEIFNKKYALALERLNKENSDYIKSFNEKEKEYYKEIEFFKKQQNINKKKLRDILKEKENIEKNNLCTISEEELKFFNGIDYE